MQGKDQTGNGFRLLILENGEIRVVPLSGSSQWQIGRRDDPSSEGPCILLHSALVSREHGWLRALEDQWYYVETAGNRNGTFHNGEKIVKPRNGRKRPVPLENGDILRIDYEDLDRPAKEGVLMLLTAADICEDRKVFPLYAGCVVQLCEHKPCEASGQSSRNHYAQIAEANGRYYLSGENRTSPILLNGAPLQGSAALREKDCIEMCGAYLFLTENQLLYVTTGSIGIEIKRSSRIWEGLCRRAPLFRKKHNV